MAAEPGSAGVQDTEAPSVDAGPATPEEVGEGDAEPPHAYGDVDPEIVAASIEAQGIGDYPQALAGARAICADQIGESPQVRSRLTESITIPALNVRGFRAGGVGNQATNTVPVDAQVSIDF